MLWLNTFLALRCKNKKTWMKQLRKEKQREEEEGLQRSRGEDIRQKCGTRGEFIVLQRSQEQGGKRKEHRKAWRESEIWWGCMWWLCRACVSRVPGGPSLVDHGWREDKSCSCTRGGGRGGGGGGDGAKQGLSLIRVSPFFYPHRLKLPQIPLTRNPAECSQSPERQLT